MAAMTKSNVELARELTEAWNRSDWESMADLFWPDAEGQAPKGWPEAEDAKGWPALRRQFERLRDAWAEDRFNLDSSEPIDDDRVLVQGRWWTRGKESGIEGEFETWILAMFRDRRIARVEFYLDRDEAMRAVARSD
jgi:ketosteroid isomerase-like protein